MDPGACARVRALVRGGESLEAIEYALDRTDPGSLGAAACGGRVRAAVLHLLWRGELVTDLTTPLCRNAELWPAGQDRTR